MSDNLIVRAGTVLQTDSGDQAALWVVQAVQVVITGNIFRTMVEMVCENGAEATVEYSWVASGVISGRVQIVEQPEVSDAS